MCRAALHGGRRCHGRGDGGAARRAGNAAAAARYRERRAAEGPATAAYLAAVASSVDPAAAVAGRQKLMATVKAAGVDTSGAIDAARAAIDAWRAETTAPGAHGRGRDEHRGRWRDDPARVRNSTTAEAARHAADLGVTRWCEEQLAAVDAEALTEAKRRVHAEKNPAAMTEAELAEARAAAEARNAAVREQRDAEELAEAPRRKREANLRGMREMMQTTRRSRHSTEEMKAEAATDFARELEGWAAAAEPTASFMRDLTGWARRDKTTRPAWVAVRARQLDGDVAAAEAELKQLTARKAR